MAVKPSPALWPCPSERASPPSLAVGGGRPAKCANRDVVSNALDGRDRRSDTAATLRIVPCRKKAGVGRAFGRP